MKDDIKRYFERFGKVEIVRCIEPRYDKTEYCFVQFETTEGAKAALTKKNHRIGNIKVRVKPAHSHHQPDSEDYDEDLYNRSDSDDYFGGDFDSDYD